MQANESHVSTRPTESVILLWLDSNVDRFIYDYQPYIDKFRSIVPIIKTFSDADECVNFIFKINDKKFLMIVSNALGEQVIPIIHNLIQVCSIYVFCEHESEDDIWTNQWTKIKGFSTNIESIYNLFSTDNNSPKKQYLDELERSCMYLPSRKCLFSSSTTGSNQSDSSKLSQSRLDQNFVLIWLDSNMNESNEDYRLHISRLRFVINTIKTFTDVDKCLDYITDSSDSKIFLILSCVFNEQLLSLIHDISQLHSIYLVYRDEKNDQIGMNDKTKLKGVFSHVDPVCTLLQLETKQCDHDLISISIVSLDDLNELEPMFIYSQVLKEILLDTKHPEWTMKELTQRWREKYSDNEYRLKIIDEFEQQYHLHSPIWWYSRDCFIYQVVNQAIRTINIEELMYMGFFLRDIHRQIKDCYDQQFNTDDFITVYRGQIMLKNEFETLRNGKDGLLSFNNFLTTNVDPQVSLRSCLDTQSNPDMVAILFEIKIDTILSSSPFAFLDNTSVFSNQQKVLFSMYTVFRIDEITEIEERKWRVELTLTSDNDEQYKILMKHIHDETLGLSAWDRLGRLMIRMEEWDKAEEVYQILLNTISKNDQLQLAYHYHQLGFIKMNKNDLKDALRFYQKALELKQSVLSPNDSSLATTYNNIGAVHELMRDYISALVFHEKALEIQLTSLPHHHPYLVITYKQIAQIYLSMGNYTSSLKFYERALSIQQESLSTNQFDLANTYNNIGEVTRKMGNYSTALDFHQKALDIELQLLPDGHLDLANTYNQLGRVYLNMHNNKRALSFHKKAFEIQQKLLSSDHLDLAISYNDIGSLYNGMEDYANALTFFQKSLDIRRKSLSSDSPELAATYGNIGLVYCTMGNYLTALSFFEKELEINQKSLFPNHPDLATTYNHISKAYTLMSEYATALSFCQKALTIQQKCLSIDYLELANSYNHIGELTEEMEDYTSAISSFQKTLQIKQKALPPNYPSLDVNCKNIGQVFNKMGEYLNALGYYQKALDVQQTFLPSKHPDLAVTYQQIGMIYFNLKDWTNALLFYQKALEIQQKSSSRSDPHMSTTYSNIGTVHQRMGNYAYALASYKKALEIGKHSIPANHPDLQYYIDNVTRLQDSQ